MEKKIENPQDGKDPEVFGLSRQPHGVDFVLGSGGDHRQSTRRPGASETQTRTYRQGLQVFVDFASFARRGR